MPKQSPLGINNAYFHKSSTQDPVGGKENAVTFLKKKGAAASVVVPFAPPEKHLRHSTDMQRNSVSVQIEQSDLKEDAPEFQSSRENKDLQKHV